MICCILQLLQRSLHLRLRILFWEKVCCYSLCKACSTWYYETNVVRSHDAVVCVHLTVGQWYWENVCNCSPCIVDIRLCSSVGGHCFFFLVCRIPDCYPVVASCFTSANTCCSTSSWGTGIWILSCGWESVNIHIPAFSTTDVCSYTRDVHSRYLQVHSVNGTTL
jgi:hypothetical protein